MNKILTKVSALALVATAALSLTGCGMKNDFIIAGKTATLGKDENAVQYSNTSSFRLNYEGDNKYTAKGYANTMSQEQADAFWKGTAKEGDNYVVLSIKFNAGAEIVYGFDKEGANFDAPDGTIVKKKVNNSEDNDVLQLILRLKDDGNKTFIVNDKEKDADKTETYTINFTDVKLTTPEVAQ